MRMVAFALLIFGCTGAAPGGIRQGHRLVTGRLVAPTPDELGSSQGTPAFQLVGVKDGSTMFFGEPFDVTRQSGGATTIPFRLELPCDQTVSLHFQRLGNSSANQLGEIVALVEFPLNAGATAMATLLPWKKDCASDPGREVKVGTVKIDFAARRVTLPGDHGGINPLTEVPDPATSAYDNPDDDGDGIPDEMDPDADGDGVEDAMEGLHL